MYSTLIENLINALRTLPGVGPKSAGRMAFHILENNRDNGLLLADALQQAIANVGNCQRCHTLTEDPICTLCSNPKRNPKLLCVVESPVDVIALEQTHSFSGFYFVLMGRLSPLDGIGPEDIGIDLLQQRLQAESFDEVILATNSTVEGEATAHYIAKLVQQQGVRCTRIAHGVPLGGELEYLDGGTLARALNTRLAI